MEGQQFWPRMVLSKLSFLHTGRPMGVFLEHLLLTKVEKLNCHIHMLPSIDYMRRHHSLPC